MKRLSLFLFLILALALSACTSPLPQSGGLTSEPQATPPAQGAVTDPAPARPEPTRPAPTPPFATPDPAAEGQDWDRTLAQALQARDFETLRSMMGAKFMIAAWRSEGGELSPDEALAQLQQVYLAEGSAPRPDFERDLKALLDGSDPLALFPQADAARAFYIGGLGKDQSAAAIAIISRYPATGRRTFYGLLSVPADAQPPRGEEFDQALARAVEARDFTALRGMMKDQFMMATFNTQLLGIPADEAITQLQGQYLAQGSTPAVRWGTDLVALLSGVDPLSLWGPVLKPVRAMHVMGLGPNGADEAVLVIGRDDASGQLYWLGLLAPQNGYFQSGTPGPAPVGEAQPTTVQYVEAKEALNVRSGPGSNYAVEGQLRQGEVAQVSGVSADGQWWQIVCTQDASGRCWISADPALALPRAQP